MGIAVYAELVLTMKHALLYVELMVNVFIVRAGHCTYEEAHGFEAALSRDRLCRSRVMYCDETLRKLRTELYNKELSEAWKHNVGNPPLRIRLYAEQELVCHSRFMHPECYETPSCVHDLETAVPYWLEMWMTGEESPCPPPLVGYICNIERNGP